MQRDQQLTKDLRLLKVVMITVIIVVVAAILFPIFARIGDPKIYAHCMSNIKPNAIALQMYCEDNDGALPSSILVSHSKKWNRGDFVKFATIRGETPVKKETRSQTLFQILSQYKHEDVAFCPKDPSDHSDPRSQVSYWYKLAIDKAWYGEGCSKPFCRLSDFENMADQIVFYEQKGFHEPVSAGMFSERATGLKNGVRISVAYLDTHVRCAREIVNSSKPAESNVRTTDPTAPGEPAYFNCEYNANKLNPPPPHIPTKYIDPHKYVDRL